MTFINKTNTMIHSISSLLNDVALNATRVNETQSKRKKSLLSKQKKLTEREKNFEKRKNDFEKHQKECEHDLGKREKELVKKKLKFHIRQQEEDKRLNYEQSEFETKKRKFKHAFDKCFSGGNDDLFSFDPDALLKEDLDTLEMPPFHFPLPLPLHRAFSPMSTSSLL